MTVRSLLRFPDPGLKRICAPVETFDDTLHALATDLLDTMTAAPGVGITAAHIGVFQRLTVIRLDPKDSPLIYANPEIIWASDDTATYREGSVSMPGVVEDVVRPKAIRYRYQDLSGQSREEEAQDFLAICIQHEIDQLDGIFWLQRLSKLKRDMLVRKWQKQQR